MIRVCRAESWLVTVLPPATDPPRPELTHLPDAGRHGLPLGGQRGEVDELSGVVGPRLPEKLGEPVEADVGIGTRQPLPDSARVRSLSQRKVGRPCVSQSRSAGVGQSIGEGYGRGGLRASRFTAPEPAPPAD